MKICLVGHDVQPSEAFSLLREALEKHGHEVMAHLGFGRGIMGDLHYAVENADIVVLGMSSSPEYAQKEIEAMNYAIGHKKPFGFYADGYGVSQRGWFRRAGMDAKFVFVLNENEVEITKDFFPMAEVVVTGNPTHEMYGDFAVKDEIRSRINVSDKWWDYIIFIAAGKQPKQNSDILIGTLYAASRLRAEGIFKQPVVVMGMHPGDQPAVERCSNYDAVAACMPVHRRICRKELVTGSELLSIADVVVNNFTSIGIEAAYKRIPVIEYATVESKQTLLEGSGSDIWPLTKMGTALEVQNDPVALYHLLAKRDFEPLKKRQAEVFPTPPAKGTAIAKMVETIERMK